MRIEELLLHMIDQNASDLHLSVGQPPQLRVLSDLKELRSLIEV